MQTFNILNLGAGVQSTALYLLARDGVLHFDFAIFADTGEEPQAVYRHLDYLKTLDNPPILIRTGGKLGDDLIQGRKNGRFVSIPAFTKDDKGKIGITRRQCTSEYKIRVVDRTIRREIIGISPGKHIPKTVRICQYFGISLDEQQRCCVCFCKTPFRSFCPIYPLIDMGWTRQDCIRYLQDILPYEVPRSACVFCPYHTNQEWQRIKTTDPQGWERAVEVDNGLRRSACRRGFKQDLFVHRSCIPLEMIDFGKLQPNTLNPMTAECAGMCGV